MLARLSSHLETLRHKSASQLFLVVDRIQFLAVIQLRSLFLLRVPPSIFKPATAAYILMLQIFNFFCRPEKTLPLDYKPMVGPWLYLLIISGPSRSKIMCPQVTQGVVHMTDVLFYHFLKIICHGEALLFIIPSGAFVFLHTILNLSYVIFLLTWLLKWRLQASL